MSETPPREGSRLGPYLLGRGLPGSELGALYEARHLETGAPALVLVPDASARAPRASWTVRSRSEVSPAYVAVEVEDAPGASTRALHELTLMYIELSGALARAEEDEEMAAFLARVPRAPRPPARRSALHLGLTALGGVTLGIGLMLLWSRPPTPLAEDVGGAMTLREADEPVSWVDQQKANPPTIGYPLPSRPLKGQLTPPCLDAGPAVEINGGCWLQLKQDAPCARGSAEHEGQCYMPVRKATPEPRSVKP